MERIDTNKLIDILDKEQRLSYNIYADTVLKIFGNIEINNLKKFDKSDRTESELRNELEKILGVGLTQKRLDSFLKLWANHHIMQLCDGKSYVEDSKRTALLKTFIEKPINEGLARLKQEVDTYQKSSKKDSCDQIPLNSSTEKVDQILAFYLEKYLYTGLKKENITILYKNFHKICLLYNEVQLHTTHTKNYSLELRQWIESNKEKFSLVSSESVKLQDVVVPSVYNRIKLN